jgi:predicted O-methyltransferase YrrM
MIELDDWALAPAALELVLSEIEGGRDRVVECGSGASTALIARRLCELGRGGLHSLEHDPGWARRARERIASEGAAERAQVVEAPLRPHPLAEPDCGWYDTAALARLPPAIDLLLVDGPPGALAANGESRYPALPLLAGRLAPGAAVILDDIDRGPELRMLERWRDEHGIEFERSPGKRIAIGVFSELRTGRPAGES